MHTALESFQNLRDGHVFQPHEIDRIVVRSSSGMLRDFMDFAPANMVDAQFSLPFALSVLAHGDRVAADWYSPITMKDPEVLSFSQRVAAEIDPEFDAEMSSDKRRPAGQALVAARGQLFEEPRIFYPLGTAQRPLAKERILLKFRDNAASRLGIQPAQSLEKAIMDIGDVDDVAEHLKLL